MKTFRVYFEQKDGFFYQQEMVAPTPDKAADDIRRQYPGAIINKIKVAKRN